MADVPFATNLLGTIDPLIAQARGTDLSWIGNLPDSYWAGQNQQYQQRQRDLFQNGIPPDMATALLKAGGAAEVPQYIALQKLAIGQQLANQPSPRNFSGGGGDNTGYTAPMGAISPPSSATATPPPEGTVPPSPSGPRASQPDQGGGVMTVGRLAAQKKVDPIQLGRELGGLGPNDPLDMVTQREPIMAALRNIAGVQAPQAPAGAAPSARIAQGFQAAQENPVLQAQRLQERQLEATAQRAEEDAADARRKGKAAAAIGDKELADQFKADAEASDKKADTIRQSLVKRSEMTKEQQNAAVSGLTPLEYAGVVGEQAKQIEHLSKLADLGIGAKGKLAQLNEVQRFGEKVGYGVVPKVQSLLGRYGIDTRGLSDIQAYERAIDFMAPSLRPEGSGRLMQTELAAFKSSLGGLMTTPEGRRLSVENLKLIHEFSSKVGEIASDTSLSPRQRYKEIYGLDVPSLSTTWTGPTGAMYIVKDGKITGRAR